MLSYIIRRILLLVPTLIGITAVVFFVMALAPGGFGGAILNSQGAQMSSQEARQMHEYFMRRYGLDQPVVVQYGRWLNDVSPIGFLNSSQKTYSKKTKTEVKNALSSGANPVPKELVKQAVAVVLALARYQDADPLLLTARVKKALVHPVQGLSLYELVGAEAKSYTQEKIASDTDVALILGQRDLLNDVQFQAESRSRILFSHGPRFKMPNLGLSLRGRKVTALIAQTLPITLLLNAISIPLIYLIAIITGLYAANKRGGWFDVSSGVILLGLWSVPVIWAGVIFIGYLANEQYLNWFPIAGLHSIHASTFSYLPHWSGAGFQRGYLLDVLWHLVLPVVCLSYGGFAVLAKITRGAVLDSLTSDFVRTARAKGVSEKDVLFRHAFRNSILPLITIAASILPEMLAGSIIVETIFSIHGMGKLGVSAAFMKDKELVMGVTLISGLLGLVSWIIRDIWYAMADPRVSYE